MNGLALCAGAGGLELGLRIAIGERYRCVAYVERDAYAAACLVARMEDSAMDRAPIWDDLTTFDGASWSGTVDIISAGFPCQPWSNAGQKRGLSDERWIWPSIADIIRYVRPRFVFLENVPGLVIRDGLGPVLGRLAEMGFDAEWLVVSASAVGAPHIRERVYILAHATGERQTEFEWIIQQLKSQPSDEVFALAHARRGAVRIDDRQGWGAQAATEQIGAKLDHAARSDRQSRPRRERAFNPNSEMDLPAFPPAREGDEDEWRRVIYELGRPDLVPALTRPEAAIVADVRRMADGFAFRSDRIRLCGNGVVPLQAAAAFVELVRRMIL